MVTRATATTGRPPLSGRTETPTLTVPVLPPVTSPVESTRPSKNPPEVAQFTRTFLNSAPEES